jgi:myo-inositol-1(or 4)-monophosphatase
MTHEEIVASQTLVSNIFQAMRPELLAVFGNVPFTRKPDESPVTEWDVRVEEALRTALAEAYPDLGFQGEETGHHGSSDCYWLVDPIDGTSSFIRGLHYSTNMAALVQDNVAIAAVIYDFIDDHIYTAIKGQGAYKDGEPIHVNDQRQAGNLLVYSFTRDRFALVQEAFSELGIRTILPMGAAGHTFALLAEGKIDGAVALGTKMGVHDNAPGILLAEEAGARVLSYDDQTGIARHEYVIGSPLLVDSVAASGLL